ncbi:MAG: hypothetical protein KDA41_04845 [Planctomycetales bacterium]|nr:hypothetical protein [Planctomycetales bacterium]
MHAAEPMPDTPAGRLVNSSRVLVIGHRGAARHAPENTLVSFREAAKAGADVVELDYMLTSDAVQVVFHDKTLDRTTDAPAVLGRRGLAIHDVTAAELRRLDAGRWFDPRYAGARAPTLAEALDLIQKDRVTMIERKEGPADACIELLRQKELVDKVVIQAFDWDYIADARKLAPSAVLGCLGNKELSPARIKQIQAAGAQLIGWSDNDVNAAFIKTAHAAGLKVWVYTVNSPARAKQLVAGGVDGIISDDPGLMVRLRAAGWR